MNKINKKLVLFFVFIEYIYCILARNKIKMIKYMVFRSYDCFSIHIHSHSIQIDSMILVCIVKTISTFDYLKRKFVCFVNCLAAANTKINLQFDR